MNAHFLLASFFITFSNEKNKKVDCFLPGIIVQQSSLLRNLSLCILQEFTFRFAFSPRNLFFELQKLCGILIASTFLSFLRRNKSHVRRIYDLKRFANFKMSTWTITNIQVSGKELPKYFLIIFAIREMLAREIQLNETKNIQSAWNQV